MSRLQIHSISFFMGCGLLLLVLFGAGVVYAATHVSTQIWWPIGNDSTSILVKVCDIGLQEKQK